MCDRNILDTKLPSFELQETFNTAERSFVKIDSNSITENDQKQQLVRTTINQLLKCGLLIRTTSVFSAHETIDEIKTEDLRYLIAPAYLSTLLMEVSNSTESNNKENLNGVDNFDDGIDERHNTCQTAFSYSQVFLSRMKEFKTNVRNGSNADSIVPSTLQSTISSVNAKFKSLRKQQEYTSGDSSSDEEGDDSGDTEHRQNQKPLPLLIHDSTMERNLKIQRYKQEKLAKQKLHELTENMFKQANNHENNDDNHNNGLNRIGSRNNKDETYDCDIDRDRVLTLLQVWCYRCLSNMESLLREIEMLSELQKIKEENNGILPEKYRRNKHKNLDDSKKKFKPITLTRDMVKIFGQHHTPFTYTPEQWASIEHDMGLHQCCAKSSDEPVDDSITHAHEMDNKDGYEACEVKTYKARNWDDFTDENRRGMGNRYNRS